MRNVLYTTRSVGSLSAGTRVEVGEVDADSGLCQCIVLVSSPDPLHKRPIIKEVVIHQDDLHVRRTREDVLEVKHPEKFTRLRKKEANGHLPT